ncbi:MAG: Na/Pi symporter [Tissierellaceae bacterium]
MLQLIFGIIGGTTLLLYGIEILSRNLEKALGNYLKRLLGVFSGNVYSSFFLGLLVTCLVQSSTAVTLLTVGLVNSGIMGLSQALGIIYGANIGTTMTGQLMSLGYRFRLTDIALPILALGFFIDSLGRGRRSSYLGQSLMGFGLLFLGLRILNDGIPYIQRSQLLRLFFTQQASNPLVGILLGLVTTALVHSSSATVGILIVLGQSQLISLQTAIYIILGDNIGTSITAHLSSISGSINGKRVAWAHSFYNIFGAIMVLFFMPQFTRAVIYITEDILQSRDISSYIANSHSLFNLANALVFLPMTKYYERFLNWLI